MSRRHRRLALPTLAAAALAAGCLAPAAPPAARGASIKVFARLAGAADRALKTDPAPRWTAAEVTYVRFDVYAGSSATAYLTEYVDGADITTAGTTLTFTALAANTTYRIEARAFHDADGDPAAGTPGTLISKTAAPATAWKTSVVVGTDDAPTPTSTLTLQLLDRVFDGTATVAGADLTVANGDCTFAIQGAVATVVGGAANQGQPPFFSEGGQGLGTALFDPGMMVRDAEGNLYVTGQHQVFMITSDRKTYLLGGGGTDENGVGTKAATGFNYPKGLALSADGTELYVADFWNGRIVGIDLTSGDLYTPDATNDPAYSRVVAGAGTGPIGLDGALGVATLGGPTGLALAPDGALLVTSYDRGTIRRVDLNSADPATDAAYVTTIAGANNDAQYVDNSTDARQGRLVSPFDIEPYKDGFLIADHGASALRKLTPLSGGGWGLTTFDVASHYTSDASGDRLIKPHQLAVDPFNRIWFTERESDAVDADLYLRCLDPAQAIGNDARLRTWVGGSEPADTRYQDGHAADATFGFAGNAANRQVGVAIDRTGTVFFSDPSTNSVRKLQ